jgi:hypothetical protein
VHNGALRLPAPLALLGQRAQPHSALLLMARVSELVGAIDAT